MKVTFRLRCKTEWGQILFVLLKDEKGFESEYEMFWTDENHWHTEIDINKPSKEIAYRYAVQDSNEKITYESNGYRSFKIKKTERDIHLLDAWKLLNKNSVFQTRVFKDCLLKRKKTQKVEKKNRCYFTLQLNFPKIEVDKHIAIIGNQEQLGNWNVDKKVRLDEVDFPLWKIDLNAEDIHFPLEYKYLIVDTKTDKVLTWENGDNRQILFADSGNKTIVTDNDFVGVDFTWKTAGVAIPVFSLRSTQSFGTGDFMDLKLLVDWAKQTGQHIIQTLPINDTILHHSNYDSYPYNAVSVYALHPIYLRLEAMGTLKNKKDQNYFTKLKTELNKNSFSDYQRVLDEKWKYFELIYEQEKETVFALASYKTFFTQNKEWLVPYAVFSYLRDKNGTPEFSTWQEYRVYNQKDLAKLASQKAEDYDKIALFYFLQYHLHIQLVEVRKYANRNKVALKSDVPIGVSPMSVDAWVEPEMFNTQMQAGAPPDDFSITGQNWGFPTYNWEEMEKDNYRWWNNRFKKFEEYFDAYRIDHILGFFRIWEIPADAVWALTGSFYPAMPYFVHDLESKGLTWNEKRFTKPYLQEEVVRAIFGEYAYDVIREYLTTNGVKSYKFKPEFDTQKKVEKYFSALGYNFTQKEVAIRDGLYQLHCEVLFVRDNRNPNMFHPRIAMHSTYSFKNLSNETRRLLDEIYIDYFYHRHNEFWKQQAMKKLPAIKNATNMLACGEDLGMVPDSVEEVLTELELLSLEIQRMPKKPNTEFAMPSDTPYLSVCTTSTHDMNPIRAWWKEDDHLTQRFYNKALAMHGYAPEKCTVLIANKIIQQHLESDAMLVILPWQDWLALDDRLRLENENAERINVPANPRNFWCYRMHLTLEQLIGEKVFNEMLKKMIVKSGR